MTEWQLTKKQRGVRSTIVTLRIDPMVAEAVQRIAKRVGRKEDGRLVTRSAVFLTGVLMLPEVQKEIAVIKKEKRGERRRNQTTTRG